VKLDIIMFDEDDLLPVSALQHLAFCPRQWGLIHLERQWADSDRTVEGRHLHEKTDDPFVVETRGDLVVARAVPLACRRIGLSGIADVVEFRRLAPDAPAPPPPGEVVPSPPGAAPPATVAGVALPGHEGLWAPTPVEYKRGQPKQLDHDKVQLCAQALCLEEMLGVPIPRGQLFYAQVRRREDVPLDGALRQRVEDLAARMHRLFREGVTPLPEPGPHCRACSLKDLCVPKIGGKRLPSVRDYLAGSMPPD
jgi:CRISPR-associated exonuclease Cas4